MIVDKRWSFNYEYDYYFYTDQFFKDNENSYLGMVKIRNKKAIFICNDLDKGRIYLGYNLYDNEILFKVMKILKKKQYKELKRVEEQLVDCKFNTELSTKTIYK